MMEDMAWLDDYYSQIKKDGTLPEQMDKNKCAVGVRMKDRQTIKDKLFGLYDKDEMTDTEKGWLYALEWVLEA